MPPPRGGEGPPFIVGARDAHPGNGADGRAEGPPLRGDFRTAIFSRGHRVWPHN